MKTRPQRKDTKAAPFCNIQHGEKHDQRKTTRGPQNTQAHKFRVEAEGSSSHSADIDEHGLYVRDADAKCVKHEEIIFSCVYNPTSR